MRFNFLEQNSIDFKHTPYVIILVQAIKAWKEKVSLLLPLHSKRANTFLHPVMFPMLYISYRSTVNFPKRFQRKKNSRNPCFTFSPTIPKSMMEYRSQFMMLKITRKLLGTHIKPMQVMPFLMRLAC